MEELSQEEELSHEEELGEGHGAWSSLVLPTTSEQSIE